MADKAFEVLADKAFEVLAKTLESYRLPTKNGDYRTATPGEFMYMGTPKMGINGNPWHTFKHCDTRNYIWLSESGKLVVPCGGAFYGGVFRR